MSRTPRADLWFSLFILLLGSAVVFESWHMPRLENLGIDPLSAPGLTPGLLGFVLALLGLWLFLQSLRRRAEQGQADSIAKGGWIRTAATLALCLSYSLILLGWLPFWAATALFLLVFVFVFSDAAQSRWKRAVIASLIAVAGSAAITLLFEQVFLVRLP